MDGHNKFNVSATVVMEQQMTVEDVRNSLMDALKSTGAKSFVLDVQAEQEQTTISLNVSGKQKEQYEAMADREGKTLEQYIVDRIAGVPMGYTMRDGKLEIHKPKSEKMVEYFRKATTEPIISAEKYEEVQKKLR